MSESAAASDNSTSGERLQHLPHWVQAKRCTSASTPGWPPEIRFAREPNVRNGSQDIGHEGPSSRRQDPRERRSSSDDAQFAFAVGHVADHPKLVLELGEVALLGFLARLGVALFALGLFGGLVAEIRDRQLAAEHVVAPKPQFGFGVRWK